MDSKLECFSALPVFANALVTASHNLQDLRYLSHSGRGVLGGSEDLELILFFLLLFSPVLCL